MAEITIKKVPSCKVVAVEGRLSKIDDKETRKIWASVFDEIFRWLETKGLLPFASAPIGIYYEKRYGDNHNGYEVCIPISANIIGDNRVKVKELPEIEVASIIHKGAYANAQESWGKLGDWIAKNGYEYSRKGAREVYLNCPKTVPESELLTEIQIPIRKV